MSIDINTTIDQTSLSTRVKNGLSHYINWDSPYDDIPLETVRDILGLKPHNILATRNLGRGSLKEIVKFLVMHELDLDWSSGNGGVSYNKYKRVLYNKYKNGKEYLVKSEQEHR